MSEANWLPGIIVLATGLFAGLVMAIRLRGQGTKASKRDQESPDIQLKIRDLEARKDDLYRRIRAAEEDKLGTEEIRALEDAAANTLRELDQLTEQQPGRAREAAKVARPTTPTEPPSAGSDAAPPRTRNPLWVGVAIGAGMIAVVAMLVYWAVEDAQPGPRMAPQAAQPATDMEAPHEGQIQVPPEVAAQIADLQGRLVADPADVMARKQLALTYVAAGQFFEAFNQASQVLQEIPDDPDALLVHGIVRLTMGQADQAVGLIDQVLAQHPDHRQALIYRGLALYQTGNVEQALDTWDMGLQMAGGNDPEFQELIHMAQTGAAQPAGMMPKSPPAAAPNSAQAAGPASQQLDPAGYQATLDLAPGAQIAPQATLYVFLRPEGGGPPVAVRRISAPRFPLEITLGLEDSMMGDELPATGILVARLDTDGDVATADATDLAAEGIATKGEWVRLTLGR